MNCMNFFSKGVLTGLLTVVLSLFMVGFNPRQTEAAIPSVRSVGAIASSAAAITPGMPTGVLKDDILLLFIETPDLAITVSGGTETWTQVSGSPVIVATATRLTVFWARASQNSPTSPTTSDAGDHQIGRMIAVQGVVKSGNPFNAVATLADNVLNTSAAIPGVTTTVSNTLVVAALAVSLPDVNGTSNFLSWNNTNLTDLVESINNTGNAGNGGGIGVVTGGKVDAGATGTTTVTLGAQAVKAMMTFALIPDTTAPTVSSVSVQNGLTVDVTFSELMGTGVTTAANYTVSGSGKGTLANNPNSVAMVSGSTYRLTWSSGEMVNGADITISVANAQDVAGNTVGTPSSGTHTAGAIGVAPTLTAVHIASNNADTTKAVTGDIVTLTFTSSESINSPTVTIASNAATVSGGPTVWSATYPVLVTDPLGIVAFSISAYNDLAGNPGSSVTTTTDASSVTILESNATVTVTMDGTGTGTINSTSDPTSADGITCPGDCTGVYTAGTLLTLLPTASSDSDFVGWTGGGCTTETNCVFAPTGTMGVTATFNQKQRVMMPGPVYYASIQAAYTACTAGTVLKLRNETFSQDLVFDIEKDVTLDGGCDATWTPQAGVMTEVIGSLTIVAGSVTVSGLSII